MVTFWASVVTFLTSAIKFSTVFIFGSTGEIVNQKSGHLNMATPGIMFLGAFGGIIGEIVYIAMCGGAGHFNSFLVVLFPIIFGFIFAAIGGAIFSFFTVTLHCNQNVVGLTLTTLFVGLSQLAMTMIVPTEAEAQRIFNANFSEAGQLTQFAFPNLSNTIILAQSWFTYIAIGVAIVVAIVLKKTRVGLNLRAVGENAAAADSAGISVNKYRYLSTIIGSGIVGLGGAFIELDQHMGTFNASADNVDAYGWIALCIVIFSLWKPLLAIAASLFFASLSILPSYIKGVGSTMSYVIDMAPYIATIIILIILSIFNGKKNQPPANLGQSYFREDR